MVNGYLIMISASVSTDFAGLSTQLHGSCRYGSRRRWRNDGGKFVAGVAKVDWHSGDGVVCILPLCGMASVIQIT